MMEKIRILFIFISLTPTSSLGQGSGSCECVAGGSCNQVPYGSLALDISVLGLFPPCPKHGDVRCCSRQGLEALYAGMLKAAISQQPARVQVKPVDVLTPPEHDHADDECGCVPRGICGPQFTRQTNECNGALELCCLHDISQSNVLVSIFTQDNSPSTTPPTPVFRPQPVFHNGRQQQDEQQPQKETQFDHSQLDNEGLPCLSATHCEKVYGYDPLDIARYGVLSPCTKRGYHRCVEPKAGVQLPTASTIHLTTTTTTTTTTYRTTTTTQRTTTSAASNLSGLTNSQKMRLVPCIPQNLCAGTLYNPGNGDHLARFGVLPRCHFGMARCIMEVEMSIEENQPRIRLPFFTKEVMEANFDLPVFTGDKFRGDMHRFFDGKLHDHTNHQNPFSRDILIDDIFNDYTPTTTTTQRPRFTTTQPPPQPSIDFNENLRAFLSQLQDKRNKENNLEAPRGATQVVQSNEDNSRNNKVSRTSALDALQKIASAAAQSTETPQITHTQNQGVDDPHTVKAPPGSRRIVELDKHQEHSHTPARTKVHQEEASRERKTGLRNFFNNQRRGRPSLFHNSRNNEDNDNDNQHDNHQETNSADKHFPNFDVEASVSKDKDGNVVISGGRKVFHLPPGILPPPGPADHQPQSGRASHAITNDGERRAEHKQSEQTVFFDPSDAPQVAEVLSKSKSSIIQVHTDDNQKMVLNVRNDQLLGILQALSSALDTFK